MSGVLSVTDDKTGSLWERIKAVSEHTLPWRYPVVMMLKLLEYTTLKLSNRGFRVA